MKKNFSIWKNEKKTQPNHPDFIIKVMLDEPRTFTTKDGKEITMRSERKGACWTKEASGGKKYMSCELEIEDPIVIPQENKPLDASKVPYPEESISPDDIPF